MKLKCLIDNMLKSNKCPDHLQIQNIRFVDLFLDEKPFEKVLNRFGEWCVIDETVDTKENFLNKVRIQREPLNFPLKYEDLLNFSVEVEPLLKEKEIIQKRINLLGSGNIEIEVYNVDKDFHEKVHLGLKTSKKYCELMQQDCMNDIAKIDLKIDELLSDFENDLIKGKEVKK